MDGFNLSLDNYTFKDAKNKRIIPEVRVALIDDGVSIDHGVEDLNASRQTNNGGRSYRSKYKVAGGTSFYESTLEDSEFRQYFVGPGRHGNTMADFINRVCLNVRLFAIRVNDAGRNTTGARFTVKSCAEVLVLSSQSNHTTNMHPGHNLGSRNLQSRHNLHELVLPIRHPSQN
jgi:hypothetical protein